MHTAAKRWGVAALALLLLAAGVAVSVSDPARVAVASAAGIEAPPGAAGDDADVAGEDAAGASEEAPGTVAGESNGAAGAIRAADDAVSAVEDASGAAEDQADAERQKLLARWDELMQERQRLRAELRRVERELVAVAGRLWPQEWERVRGRILERLEEYEERIGEYGDEISQWIPPALVEHIARRTGRTPEEVRALIESGQWRELLRGPAAED